MDKNVFKKDLTGETPVKSIESAVNESVKSVKTKKKSPFDTSLGKARRLFRYQLDRSSATKRAVIVKSVQGMGVDYSIDQFLIEYAERVSRLIDSKRFERDCDNNGLDSYTVATHVAFDGLKKMYHVLDKGLDPAPYLLSDMKQAIFPLEELHKFDAGRTLSSLISTKE